MVNKNIRYGLNINRGLSFEGILADKKQIAHLGSFMLWAIQNPHIPKNEGPSLRKLTGNLVGVAARKYPEVKRKLTTEPINADFRVTSFDALHAKISRYSLENSQPEVFELEAMGILHIPKLELFKKYQGLLPGREYLTFTPPDSNIDDIFTLQLDNQGRLRFSISVDPFSPDI